VSELDAAHLTHINYAFASIQDGKVVPGDAWTDTKNPFPGDCTSSTCLKGNFNQLNKLKKANPNLRTLISIGGWTWSGQFSDAALTVASRAKFADSAVQFIRTYGFDGVDLDWEYPVGGGLSSNKARPADKTNFTLLLQAIRGKLDAAQKQDGRTYLLTIAAGAFPEFLNYTEMSQVQKLVDWVNLMTYDYHGDWDKIAGHQAPLYADTNNPSSSDAKSNIDSTVKAFEAAGVPAKKLNMGIPLYGRGWTGCSSTGQGLYQACTGITEGEYAKGIHDYSSLEKQGLIGGHGYVRYWSNSAKVPWLFNKATGTFISYEDPESIAYKAQYIRAKGLGGATLWELGQDLNHTLQTKLYNSLN
jgi:chitinase